MTDATAVQPSRTAMLAAVARGVHRLYDAPPRVFDDPHALALVGSDWQSLYAMVTGLLPENVVRQAIGLIVARSRYAEDHIADGLFTQYVIVGAGLDSFAWRRPDALRATRLFEVDQPATQEWKRERAASLALPNHESHVSVAADLEQATLAEALDRAGFDRAQPTLFSWLGVTIYLNTSAIEATLRTVAACASGSQIVMSYSPTDDFVDPIGQTLRNALGPVATAAGESYETLMTPDDTVDLVRRCGLVIDDHPTRDDLHDRYFRARSDGLTAPTSERLITARVPATT
jgi:methyltransferase (TIGR00027 family)